jgi:hypothetical protein
MVKVDVIGDDSMGHNHISVPCELPNIDVLGVVDANKVNLQECENQYINNM